MATQRRITNIVKHVEYVSDTTEQRVTNIVKHVEYLTSGAAATWTEPTQRATSDLITAAIWNTDIVNNILWLGNSHDHDGDAGDGGTITTPVPSGAIAIFDVTCPGGWTQVSAWDGRFLKGSASYGATGGSSSHTHNQNLGTATTGADNTSNPSGRVYWYESWSSSEYFMSIRASAGASHQQYLKTGAASKIAEPPHIQVIFCKKD